MSNHPSRSAYTLIEILVATAVAMILMLAIMRMFAGIGESLNRTRAEMNLALELRRIQNLLQYDIDNRSMKKVTTEMSGTREPGYFTYQEGAMWTPSENEPRLKFAALLASPPRTAADLKDAVKGVAPYPASPLSTTQQNWCSLTLAENRDIIPPPYPADSTVGDLDDFLAFTVQVGANETQYRARGLDVTGTGAKIGVVETGEAEVAWFVRGTTLYRRVLIIDQHIETNMKRIVTVSAPLYNDRTNNSVLNPTALQQIWNNNDGRTIPLGPTAPIIASPPTAPPWFGGVVTFYDAFDYSVWHDISTPRVRLTPNSLTDLQNRKKRFGMLGDAGTFPYPCVALPRLEDQITPTGASPPPPYTVRPGEEVDPVLLPPISRDYWADLPEPQFPAPRRSEDVVMKNVLSFDVKAWIHNEPDTVPGTFKPPYFADLGWKGTAVGNVAGLTAANLGPNSSIHANYNSTYDVDTGTYDDFSIAGRYSGATLPTLSVGTAVPMSCVYDTWWGAPPPAEAPYGLTTPSTAAAALRAIQITIRAYEPQFKTVQEVRIVKRLE